RAAADTLRWKQSSDADNPVCEVRALKKAWQAVRNRTMNDDRHVAFRGFDPYDCVPTTRRRLPHWRQTDVTYFVTFRLADSLPQTLLHQWRDERAIWMRLHPSPWRADEEHEYKERFIGPHAGMAGRWDRGVSNAANGCA